MPVNNDTEFYVGYQPKAPAGLARLLRKASAGLLAICAVFAMILVINQNPFYPSVYEFGNVQTFEGVIQEHPYPALRVGRPGQAGALPDYSQYYLVDDGKFGAADLAKGLDGKRVQLSGSLVYRDDQTMIKIVGGAVTPLHEAATHSENNREAEKILGAFQLNGEIVDSQCYLGVMNPGELKPHKECAVRCISGGVPPVFIVRKSDGTTSYFLLVSTEGKSVNREVLPFVADPIRITGQVVQHGNLMVLYADPQNYKRLN